MAQLILSAAIESTAVNLTTVGGIDWADWNDNPPELTAGEWKSGGGQTISAALYGGGSVARDGLAPRTMSWTDGANTASDSNTTLMYNDGFTVGMGFEVTYQANTSPKTAELYIGYYSADVRVTAILSDGSVANQVDSSTFAGADSTTFMGTVSVDFAAASAGQTMTIRVEVLNSLGGSRNVGIQAAAVSAAAAPATLVAGQGSFALNGQSAGLLATHFVSAGQGSFALNGQNVTLTQSTPGYTMTAAQGSYALLGSDAYRDISMVLEQGSYALTGQAALLTIGLLLTAAQGSYNLIGRDLGLIWSGAPITSGGVAFYRRRGRR